MLQHEASRPAAAIIRPPNLILDNKTITASVVPSDPLVKRSGALKPDMSKVTLVTTLFHSG